MAFKYDWTPGISPIVAKIILPTAFILTIFAWLENYPLWVPIIVSLLIAMVIIFGYRILKHRKIKK